MNDDQWYDDWRRRRRQGEAPPGFAERVMGAVEAAEADGRQRSRPERSPWHAMVAALVSSRLSKVAVCSLAAATCVLRLLHVVAIFVAQ
jgi:hypothetical protein